MTGSVIPTIFINGKFTCQRTTGVQRVAEELVRAIDALPAADGRRRWVLLCPPGGGLHGLRRIEQRPTGGPARPLHLWEQAVLPRAARGGHLLNLAATAPWFAGRQSVLLYDAAVFDHPEAYRPAFVAWYRRLFRRLARRAEHLFTGSAFSQARLASHLGVPSQRLSRLSFAADHLERVDDDDRVLDTLGLRSRRFLLAVGSANPTKNLDRLVQAHAALGEPGVPLVIVGARHPRVFADAVGVADPPGVLRAGAVDDAALKSLYRHAVALVFPSVYEGFGLPPLEAMACGCPVAVSRAASLPEVCGDAAIFFDPASTDAIVQAMTALLRDDALRERLRADGLERARAHRWADAAATLQRAIDEAEAA